MTDLKKLSQKAAQIIASSWEEGNEEKVQLCNNINNWIREKGGEFNNDVFEKLLNTESQPFELQLNNEKKTVVGNYWTKLWVNSCTTIIDYVLNEAELNDRFKNKQIEVYQNNDRTLIMKSYPLFWALSVPPNIMGQIAKKLTDLGANIGMVSPNILRSIFIWKREIFYRFIDNLISEGQNINQCYNFTFAPNIDKSVHLYDKISYLINHGLDLNLKVCKYASSPEDDEPELTIFDTLVYLLAQNYKKNTTQENSPFKKDILQTIKLLTDKGGILTKEFPNPNTILALLRERQEWPQAIKNLFPANKK